MKIQNKTLFYSMIFFALMFACSIMINSYASAVLCVILVSILALYIKGEPKVVSFTDKVI